ncbi:MAG: NifU family protein [Bacteroidota bacterium]
MSKAEHQALVDKVDAALEEIRPHLEVDGGNIEVVEITDDMTVRVKWLGNCEFCSMSAMTMKAGVEQTIKSKIPEIQAIEAVNGLT